MDPLLSPVKRDGRTGMSKKGMTEKEILEKIRKTVRDLKETDSSLVNVVRGEEQTSIERLNKIGGLGLQIFALVSFLQLKYLHREIPDEVRDEIEGVFMKYHRQLTSIMGLVGEPIYNILKKKTDFLIKPGDEGFFTPPTSGHD